MLGRYLTLLALVVVVVVCSESQVLATTCRSLDGLSDAEYKKELDKTTAIFIGEVISISELKNPNANSGDRYEEIVVKIERTWRGTDSGQITVRHDLMNDSFAKEFGGSGMKKLFVLFTRPDGAVGADYCSLAYLFREDRIKSILGEGYIVEHPPVVEAPVQPDDWLTSVWKWIASWF